MDGQARVMPGASLMVPQWCFYSSRDTGAVKGEVKVVCGLLYQCMSRKPFAWVRTASQPLPVCGGSSAESSEKHCKDMKLECMLQFCIMFALQPHGMWGGSVAAVITTPLRTHKRSLSRSCASLIASSSRISPGYWMISILCDIRASCWAKA